MVLLEAHRLPAEIQTLKNGYCVNYVAQDVLFYGGKCPFSSGTNRMISEVSCEPDVFNNTLCGRYNRKGLLCSECVDGYGPGVFSLQLKCVNCSKMSTGTAIILYLLIKTIPITLFFARVAMFHINITSGPLLGYIIFCQFYVWITMAYTHSLLITFFQTGHSCY